MRQIHQLLLVILIAEIFSACSSDNETCVEKVWYADIDQDGFGDDDNQLTACEKPNGYVENNTDCDDSLNSAHPDAIEIHNGIDDNCNGVIDECGTNSDCNGICFDQICVQDTTSFTYDFAKYYFTHGLTDTSIPYHFFEPKQSLNSNDNKFPLIIALHGIEYFANDENTFLAYETTGYFALAWLEEQNQENYPAFVVAPNLYNDLWFEDFTDEWSGINGINLIDTLLDSLLANNQNIDSNKIYLTGHSAGGIGTWCVGAELHEKIAAIVPLSAAFNSSDSKHNEIQASINNGNFNDLPVWGFIHRADADDADGSRSLFQAIENISLSPVYTHWVGATEFNLSDGQIRDEIEMGKKHFYTEYNYPCSADECHFAMGEALREPFLFEWLFMQSKN